MHIELMKIKKKSDEIGNEEHGIIVKLMNYISTTAAKDAFLNRVMIWKKKKKSGVPARFLLVGVSQYEPFAIFCKFFN